MVGDGLKLTMVKMDSDLNPHEFRMITKFVKKSTRSLLSVRKLINKMRDEVNNMRWALVKLP
jgi:hypothetical protein